MEPVMTTVVFEDTRGEQVLVTVFTDGAQRTMTIAQRPDPDATWGPPLRPVLVDGSKPDVNMVNPWSQVMPS